MKPIKANFPGYCWICLEEWGIGDLIVRIVGGFLVFGWYDFGRRKGQKWSKRKYWVHAGDCATEANELAEKQRERAKT
jgi:hypothetical protein